MASCKVGKVCYNKSKDNVGGVENAGEALLTETDYK